MEERNKPMHGGAVIEALCSDCVTAGSEVPVAMLDTKNHKK